MARAKRRYLSGYAWHITHRCHKREFLLKFGRDRRRWLQWLFEAKKRYYLCITAERRAGASTRNRIAKSRAR